MKKDSFSKILVCIDGSKNSDKALSKAASLAENCDSKLVITHVMDTSLGVDFWDNSEYVGIISKSLAKWRKESKKLLKINAEKIKNKKINYQTKLLEGNVADEIMKLCKKENFDLVVIGSRGIGGFKKLLLGSVSTNIVNHSSCSVLTVK